MAFYKSSLLVAQMTDWHGTAYNVGSHGCVAWDDARVRFQTRRNREPNFSTTEAANKWNYVLYFILFFSLCVFFYWLSHKDEIFGTNKSSKHWSSSACVRASERRNLFVCISISLIEPHEICVELAEHNPLLWMTFDSWAFGWPPLIDIEWSLRWLWACDRRVMTNHKRWMVWKPKRLLQIHIIFDRQSSWIVEITVLLLFDICFWCFDGRG